MIHDEIQSFFLKLEEAPVATRKGKTRPQRTKPVQQAQVAALQQRIIRMREQMAELRAKGQLEKEKAKQMRDQLKDLQTKARMAKQQGGRQ